MEEARTEKGMRGRQTHCHLAMFGGERKSSPAATLGGTGQNPRRCNGAHNGEDLPSRLLEHRLRDQHPGDSRGTVAHGALLGAGAIALDFNLAEEQLMWPFPGDLQLEVFVNSGAGRFQDIPRESQ